MDARSLMVAAAALAAGACAAVSVKSDYDHGVSFDRLQTYDWMEAAEDTREDLQAVSPFLERRLERTVDDALGRQGYQRQTEGEVDFLVTAFVVTPSLPEGDDPGYRARSRVSVGVGIGFGSWGHPYYGRRYFGYPYGYWYGGRPYAWFPYVGYPFAFSYPLAYSYPFALGVGYSPYYSSAEYMTAEGFMPGTLVVDIVDNDSGELIWRGWANRALAFAPEDLEELPAFIDDTVRKIMASFPPDAR